ncbi:MAG: excisionase [Clostridiales bacterium]|nr:excisionase [Clostridiales bacterium]
MLGISRPLAYELTKRSGFPAIRISERRIIIPSDKLSEWLSREADRVI